MEFRNPDDHITTATTTTATTTMTFNQTSQIRTSAFSKPTLSPSSSLILSPRTNFLSSSSTRNNNNNNNGNCFELPHTSSSPPPPPPPPPPLPVPVLASTSPVKYRECLRNHAASIGGHVVDGCGEFMPSETDAMKCAACGCHRSFHRKDDYRLSNGGSRRRGRSSNHVPLLLPPPLAPNPHLGSSATESSSEELNAPAQTHSAAVQQPKKRFRTKFTAEQKEKMLAFSERVGWRIQRQDEAIVEQFCAEAGVRRQVLKVWMHNNKNTVKKQLQQPQQQQ
ncbi:Homeodomain ZF-HD class domain-containing protein [Dioscorea alata]|uniref:Homeodomain ZF-HD class domain-containing protein n=1 Tax=Dioscorea alata TaxID=55571 RepID=A0ACB7TR36_DIOAL|nr:Homeodomain ZF-HD class domain-containing protein [Dioscorea alata]